jgi:hypothetical protein
MAAAAAAARSENKKDENHIQEVNNNKNLCMFGLSLKYIKFICMYQYKINKSITETAQFQSKLKFIMNPLNV